MYRMYRKIQNLDQNFSLKSLQNLSESSRMTPDTTKNCLNFGDLDPIFHVIVVEKLKIHVGWGVGDARDICFL